MKRFLVTGGAGFIGSHLVDALLEAGYSVRVLDNLSSGKIENISNEADFFHGSVDDPETVQAALEGVDGCFHLAAVASVARSIEDWGGTSRTNILGTGNIFEQSSRYGSVPVVYASSAAVYGNPLSTPISETAPLRPLSPYGADKAASELYAGVANAIHGTGSVGLRFFNVYGPRQDPSSPYSGVISVFHSRLVNGEPVTIFGDGGQTRDFVYVRDVVTALMAAMRLAEKGGAHVLNVCTGVQTTVLDLARLLEDILGVNDRVRHQSAREGDIRISCGNPAELQKMLAVRTCTELREGLIQLIAQA